MNAGAYEMLDHLVIAREIAIENVPFARFTWRLLKKLWLHDVLEGLHAELRERNDDAPLRFILPTLTAGEVIDALDRLIDKECAAVVAAEAHAELHRVVDSMVDGSVLIADLKLTRNIYRNALRRLELAEAS